MGLLILAVLAVPSDFLRADDPASCPCDVNDPECLDQNPDCSWSIWCGMFGDRFPRCKSFCGGLECYTDTQLLECRCK